MFTAALITPAQNWKQPKFLTDEYIVIYLAHGIPLSNTKVWTTTVRRNVDESQKHADQKPDICKLKLYGSIYMNF